jgi:hypothetical protein
MEIMNVGDRVRVESEKVGVEPRSGVVTGIAGTLVRVRWDGGQESSFVPSAGSMQVLEAAKKRKAR